MAAIELVLRQADSPELVGIARDLFREYERAIGTDLEYQGFNKELAALPSPYLPPAGALLLAQAGQETAGCVALRPLQGGAAEIKRLYVRPAFRSGGLGKRLVVFVSKRFGHQFSVRFGQIGRPDTGET